MTRSQELRASAWIALVTPMLALGGCQEAAVDCSEPSQALFERRILPLLQDDQPKSCNQCHLSGIDLGIFARQDTCEAMACLVQDELVDLDLPEDSVILRWILRAEPESDLITDEVIQAEYDAFEEWIVHESACGTCAEAQCVVGEDDPFCDLEREPDEPWDTNKDPGDCNEQTLEGLFLETVYATRGRCFPCHFDGIDNVEAPKWIVQAETCELSSLATLRNVMRSNYIDLEDPERSFLLTKPLAEEDGGLEHGGHDKFRLEGDDGYTRFAYFVERYATCERGTE